MMMIIIIIITIIIETWTMLLVLHINLKHKIATPTNLNVYISFIGKQQKQLHKSNFPAVNVFDISRLALEFPPTNSLTHSALHIIVRCICCVGLRHGFTHVLIHYGFRWVWHAGCCFGTPVQAIGFRLTRYRWNRNRQDSLIKRKEFFTLFFGREMSCEFRKSI